MIASVPGVGGGTCVVSRSPNVIKMWKTISSCKLCYATHVEITWEAFGLWATAEKS